VSETKYRVPESRGSLVVSFALHSISVISDVDSLSSEDFQNLVSSGSY
jgi:hypothetical protein